MDHRRKGVSGRAVVSARARARPRFWPGRSRCSRCPTATSGCAGTSTRESPRHPRHLLLVLRGAPVAVRRAGYGYPEAGQTIVNVTNGKLIRLLVDDEPFDVRYGAAGARAGAGPARGHADPRRGLGVAAGGRVRVRSTRLVSLTQRAVAAIEYVVEAVDESVRLIVQSELVANEPIPPRSGDPGWPPCWRTRCRPWTRTALPRGGAAAPHTAGLLMAAGMDHLVEAPGSEHGERGDATGRDHLRVQPRAGAAAAHRETPRPTGGRA